MSRSKQCHAFKPVAIKPIVLEHLWKTLEDLHDGHFDYSKSDEIFNDKNIKLLILSMRSFTISDGVNAARLCYWLFADDQLKNGLIKFVKFNGMKYFAFNILAQIIHLESIHGKSEYTEFMADAEDAMLTFFKIVVSNKNNYLIIKDMDVLAGLASMLSRCCKLSDLCRHILWSLVANMMGCVNSDNVYESNHRKLNWSILVSIENALIQIIKLNKNDELFQCRVDERIGSVLYGLWHNRCVLYDKPVNIQLLHSILTILDVNINYHRWRSVNVLIGLLYTITNREIAKYRPLDPDEYERLTPKQHQEYLDSIKNSNLYQYVDKIMKIVIKTFQNGGYMNTVILTIRNLLHFKRSFVFQQEYSVNNQILLWTLLKYTKHKSYDFGWMILHCISIIFCQSNAEQKEFLLKYSKKILKYLSWINIDELTENPETARIWLGYILKDANMMQIRNRKVRIRIDDRLDMIRDHYVSKYSNATDLDLEQKKSLQMGACCLLIQQDLLKFCCYNCRRKKSKSTLVLLQQCKGCGYVKYCGRKCQKRHWIHHKPLCLTYQCFKSC